MAAGILVEHLFPPRFFRLPGLETALEHRQGGNREHVGGDLIDAYRLIDGRTALSIADISGKGLKAAVDAAFIKYSMRAYASEDFSPERVLRSLNRLCIEKNAHEDEASYATVFFASFDPATNTLQYASAAHEPVAVCEPGRSVYQLDITAPMLGVFETPGDLFGESSIKVSTGTLLIAATDGLTECRSPDGGWFGMPRFLQTIDENRYLEVKALLEVILSAAEAFSDKDFQDDTAVLVARFL